jgi:hypothetical protein
VGSRPTGEVRRKVDVTTAPAEISSRRHHHPQRKAIVTTSTCQGWAGPQLSGPDYNLQRNDPELGVNEQHRNLSDFPKGARPCVTFS